MDSSGLVTICLLVANFLVSYQGIKDESFLNRYSFNVPIVRLQGDYKRFITSGFVHSNWIHLIMNMIALYSFGEILESSIGMLQFALLYFISLIAGNILTIYIHRHKSFYNAVGASGAISGVIFACIALYPDMRMGLMFLPVQLPAWFFGLLYILYCMFGIRAQRDNIGHDAHLGGGLAGLATICIMFPLVLEHNYFPILLIAVPSLVFIFLLLTRPEFLLVERPFSKAEGVLTIEDRYNSSKRMNEMELNRLLDKISLNGMQSLSRKEKERLEELSRVK